MAKEIAQQGGIDNFDISFGGGKIAAEISIKQKAESLSSSRMKMKQADSVMSGTAKSFDSPREHQIRKVPKL